MNQMRVAVALVVLFSLTIGESSVAQDVTRGRLHLDDVGALVGEQPRREGARDHLREVDDADSVEGTRHAG